MSSPKETAPPLARLPYPWFLVGLLWLCGFFNYADRQAVSAVIPLLQMEFDLNNKQLGWIGSSFSLVYAAMAPISGYLVDRASRRWLIVGGLGFWSLICSGTALSRRFWHLLTFRALEGLGESCYFPASMSILSDYHGPRTRSRAMSLHQTSVYAGTVVGSAMAGLLAESYGWRSPFWILGILGMGYALFLPFLIVEPRRGQADAIETAEPSLAPAAAPSMHGSLLTVVRVPSAVGLLAAFSAANFVAAVMLFWLPKLVFSKFSMGVGRSALVAALFPLASLFGALCGGPLADRAAARVRGGRMLVQAGALLAGAPWVFIFGTTSHFQLFIAALIVAGFCKGLYDANIFASIYDVVRPEVRGTAAGLMNTVAWAGGAVAPWAIGWAADRRGLSPAFAATSVVYVAASLLAFIASRLAPQRK